MTAFAYVSRCTIHAENEKKKYAQFCRFLIFASRSFMSLPHSQKWFSGCVRNFRVVENGKKRFETTLK